MMYPVVLATNISVIFSSLSAIAAEAFPEGITLHLKTGPFYQLEETLEKGCTQMLILDLTSITDVSLKEFQRLVRRFPLLKIMVIYRQMDKDFFRALFVLGVEGVLSISSSLEEVAACMNKVYKNKLYIENDLLLIYLKKPKRQMQLGLKYSGRAELTVKEKTVAKLLVEGKSNTQICSLLKLQPSTVSTFKRKVFKKLRVINLLELKKLDYIAV